MDSQPLLVKGDVTITFNYDQMHFVPFLISVKMSSPIQADVTDREMTIPLDTTQKSIPPAEKRDAQRECIPFSMKTFPYK